MSKKVLTVLGIFFVLSFIGFVVQIFRYQNEVKKSQALQREFLDHKHIFQIRSDFISYDIKMTGGKDETCRITHVKVDQAHMEANISPTYKVFTVECEPRRGE